MSYDSLRTKSRMDEVLTATAAANLLLHTHDPLERLREKCFLHHGTIGLLVLGNAIRCAAATERCEEDLYSILQTAFETTGIARIVAELQSVKDRVELLCGPGPVSCEKLMQLVRPVLYYKSSILVSKAFGSMDPEGTGVIHEDMLRSRYCHPIAKSGETSSDEGLNELTNIFRKHSMVPGYITRSEFLDYYYAVYSGLETEEQFQWLIKVGYGV